jgi:predicted small secreted protein
MNPILLLKSNVCGLPRKLMIAWPAWVIALILFGASLGLNSCGTARGFGDDVQTAGHGVHKAGEKIEEAASR